MYKRLWREDGGSLYGLCLIEQNFFNILNIRKWKNQKQIDLNSNYYVGFKFKNLFKVNLFIIKLYLHPYILTFLSR